MYFGPLRPLFYFNPGDDRKMVTVSLLVAAWWTTLLPAAHQHPLLLHNDSLLATTWARLARKDTTLRGAVARVEAEARGHLRAGPFSVTTTGATPPSGDKHDYVSIGVYWWPCARTPGLGECDLALCAHGACNCSSAEVCNRTGAHCDARTGLPWQSCDGHENRKQIATGGLPQLRGVHAAVSALAEGFYWTRNEQWAQRAVLLIETFFLNEATAMNPNFRYGQSLGYPCEPPACPAPGVPAGSGSGLVEIDAALADVLEAIALLTHPAPCKGSGVESCPGSPAWTAQHDAQMTKWLRQWLAWLKTSPFSTWACNFENNHNAACRHSWLAVSLWIGDGDTAAALVAGAKEPQWTNGTGSGSTGTGMPYQKLGAADCAGCNGACTGTCGKAPIGGQIDATGFLPQESNRINSIGYTTVELQNLFRLAQISRAATSAAGHHFDDLFGYTSQLGGQSSIRGALDFLVPFALGHKTWTHHTETTTWAIFSELRMAATVWGNASYAEWAASAAVQATGCLNVGVQNCSDAAALLWWPITSEVEEEEGGGV
jgi:hypothetical protein